MVARRGPGLDPAADLGGDPVSLLRPEAKASRRTGAGAVLTRWARSRLLTPARTSSLSGSLNRISRWAASRIGASDR